MLMLDSAASCPVNSFHLRCFPMLMLDSVPAVLSSEVFILSCFPMLMLDSAASCPVKSFYSELCACADAGQRRPIAVGSLTYAGLNKTGHLAGTLMGGGH